MKRLVRWLQWKLYAYEYRRYRAEAWADGCAAVSFDMWMDARRTK